MTLMTIMVMINQKLIIYNDVVEDNLLHHIIYNVYHTTIQRRDEPQGSA